MCTWRFLTRFAPSVAVAAIAALATYVATGTLAATYVSEVRVGVDLHQAYGIKDPGVLASTAAKLRSRGEQVSLVDLDRQISFVPYRTNMTGVIVRGSSPEAARETALALINEFDDSRSAIEDLELKEMTLQKINEVADINRRALMAIEPVLPIYNRHPDPDVRAAAREDMRIIVEERAILEDWIDTLSNTRSVMERGPEPWPAPVPALRLQYAALAAAAFLLISVAWSYLGPRARQAGQP